MLVERIVLDDMREDKLEEFSEESITKAVLNETLQHPLTIIPATLGGVSLVAMLLLGPLAVEFFIAAVIFSTLGVATWVINYFLRGSVFVQRYFERLLSEQQRAKRASYLQIREKLAELVEYPEALRAYDELMNAYDKFLGMLKEQSNQPITVSELSKHAQATLDKGMETLNNVAGVLSAMQSVDISKLSMDKQQLEETLSRYPENNLVEQQRRQREATEKRIQALQERIDTYHECETLAQELLASCEQCENALENGLLKLSGRAAISGATPDVDDVVASMEMSVESVRRVEEMLKNLSPSAMTPDKVRKA